MSMLNIKQLEAYPLTLDQFDGNIRDMVESIYVGPQGNLLETINQFNSDYTTNLSITKQFTLKPGGYNDVKKAYSNFVLRWDMRPRGIGSIFDRISSYSWRYSQFKDKMMDIDRQMKELKRSGLRWQDNTEELEVQIVNFKTIVTNAIEKCSELYPDITIEVKIWPIQNVQSNAYGRSRRGSYGYIKHTEITAVTDDIRDYQVAFIIKLKDPIMTVHLLAPNDSGENVIQQVNLPMQDIICISSTYLLPLISRNWARQGARSDINDTNRYYSFLDVAYLSPMRLSEHPYASYSMDKYAYDSYNEDDFTWTMPNLCTGNMTEDIKSSLLNMQIEAHITHIRSWLTNFYIPQTNPLNRIKRLFPYGRSKYLMSLSHLSEAFVPETSSWENCTFPDKLREELERDAGGQRYRRRYNYSNASPYDPLKKKRYMKLINWFDMPCHTCYDQENCRANALISLLFKEKSLSDINEGLIGCYYTWHEFDKAHFNESRRVDYIEDLIIYGWTKNVVSLSHTIYMMNTIVKQTTVILDEGEDTETIGNLCINHPYNNSCYLERMERLWTLGRASVEEIYYLLTHPKKDGPTIDVDFIFSYNRTMFLLFRSEDELKEVERDERDDDAWDRVSEWLEDDDQHPPSDSELPFLGGRTVPIENENLTDEQRTIEWATSLGGGANNL